MSYRKTEFYKDSYYHIFNRGANKQRIFYNSNNYEYLVTLMIKYSRIYQVGIVNFCLMPNHYHFLIHQVGKIPVSRFINVLFNSYVQALNKQQVRKGTLFESRFKHALVGDLTTIPNLMKYIHLNPVTSHLVNKPEEWKYSDYIHWAGLMNIPQDRSNEIKISAADSLSEINEWNNRRINKFRNILNISSPDVYKEMVEHYVIVQKEEEKYLRQYLFD
jgi:putative transposase